MRSNNITKARTAFDIAYEFGFRLNTGCRPLGVGRPDGHRAAHDDLYALSACGTAHEGAPLRQAVRAVDSDTARGRCEESQAPADRSSRRTVPAADTVEHAARAERAGCGNLPLDGPRRRRHENRLPGPPAPGPPQRAQEALGPSDARPAARQARVAPLVPDRTIRAPVAIAGRDAGDRAHRSGGSHRDGRVTRRIDEIGRAHV